MRNQWLIADCGIPTAPSNGDVDTSQGTEFLAQVTYTCASGYTLEGSTVRTCQASGEWNGMDPSCKINGLYILFWRFTTLLF